MEKTNQNKSVIYVIVVLVVLLFAYVAFSVYKNNQNKNMTNEQQATTTPELRVAQAGDIIVINYSGKFQNGTEFDSSYKRGQPLVFQVGVGQVIQGWDEGLIGVKKGDKKTLTITPDKAYGSEDVKGPDGKVVIPKNSTLIFDVEIVEVVSKEDAERMVKQQQEAIKEAGTSTTE